MNIKHILFAMAFAIAYAAFTPAANAALAAVSQENGPSSGFPLWYRDMSGTALELCLDQNGFCILPPLFDPAITHPARHIGAIGPETFPDEAKYWMIKSTIYDAGTYSNGTARLSISLDGRFASSNGLPAQGLQKTFFGLNLEIRGVTLAPDSAYTVTHPFGSFVFYTDSSGAPVPGAKGHIFKAEDGCVAAPCDFSLALPAFSTGVSKFLGWDTGTVVDGATGKKYLGDGKTPHAIEDGPGGAVFRIEGPDAGGAGKKEIETNLWIVSGKISDASQPNVAGPKVALSDNHTGPFVKGSDSVLITAEFESASEIAEGADSPRISIGSDVIGAPMAKTSNLAWTYLWNVPSVIEGTEEVSINAKDTGANPNAPATGKIYYFVDNTAPMVPSVAFPLSAVFLNADSIFVSGIAEANSLVRIKSAADGTVLGAQQLAGGLRDYRIRVSLAQNAENNLTVTATDAAGNEGPAEAVPAIIEDNTNLTVALSYNPARPLRGADSLTITATFAGVSPVNESKPPKISIDYAGDGSDIVLADMAKKSNLIWTYIADIPAGNDGVARVKIDAKSSAGASNLPAFNNRLIVDNTLPSAPTVVSPDVALSVNAVAFDIRGSAEEASLVKIYSGQNVVGMQQLLRDAVTYGILTNLLQNAVNDFTVTATDAAGNEGPAAVVPAITEDSIAPNITGTPGFSVTHDTAIISWTTDEESTSEVSFGTTSNMTSTASAADFSASHSVTLAGLSPLTQYFFTVDSCDAAGNCAASEQFNFTTLAAPQTPPTQPPSGGGGGGGSSGGTLSGGGGGGGSVCFPSWNCTAFSACIDGRQARSCTDTRKCGYTSGMPAIRQPCTTPSGGSNETAGTVTEPQTETNFPPKEVKLPLESPKQQEPTAPTGMFLGITNTQWLWVLAIWIAAAIIANHYRKKWIPQTGQKKEEF